jgi:glycosyltransferase involved in cell wall biosynthesis
MSRRRSVVGVRHELNSSEEATLPEALTYNNECPSKRPRTTSGLFILTPSILTIMILLARSLYSLRLSSIESVYSSHHTFIANYSKAERILPTIRTGIETKKETVAHTSPKGNTFGKVSPNKIPSIINTSASRIAFRDWPLSQLDLFRRDTSKEAALPRLAEMEEIECPQCASVLTGAVYGKRILLIGHDLNFAGAEVWLLRVGQLLEKAGGVIRFLFLSPPGPLLEEHKGMSYIVRETKRSYLVDKKGDETTREENTLRIEFTDFDLIMANTITIETWYTFFERAGKYLSREEMKVLMHKTVFCIHEYIPERQNQKISSLLSKTRKVLFDSNAGREQWIKAIPALANNSATVWPGIPKSMIQKLINVSASASSRKKGKVNEINVQERKRVMRESLNITSLPEDIVILQAASLEARKGVFELIEAFEDLCVSMTDDFSPERALILVLLGPTSRSHGKIVRQVNQVNTRLQQKHGSRSRIILKPPTTEVSVYYGAADIFVLNSVCENFGMVTVEAMFAGLPTIARNCGGASEIVVDGQTGLLLPNERENRIELVQALRKLITGPNWTQTIKSMGEKGLKRARYHFSYARMGRELSNIFSFLDATSTKKAKVSMHPAEVTSPSPSANAASKFVFPMEFPEEFTIPKHYNDLVMPPYRFTKFERRTKLPTYKKLNFIPNLLSRKPYDLCFQVVGAKTLVLDNMEIHAGVLGEGTIAHSPHVHEEEEILIVFGNEFEDIHLDADGSKFASERLKAGSFIYYPVGNATNHTVRNPTAQGTSFLLFKWRNRNQGTFAKEATTKIQTFTFGHLGNKRHEWLLSFPTQYLSRLVSHYNTFRPGKGYDQHQDNYDIGMLLLQGTGAITGQLGNQTVTAPTFLYLVANQPHSMVNVGKNNIHLLVFEFQP